ncbi:MAG: branched-chain amino acid transaminase [Gemmatimonadota bacterium]|nr:branched-chain amino acid transaminase [Gemmatimonadota bacterium]
MAITEAKYIWKDGEIVAWHDAKVHILSLAVQFGSSVFEGIRCYATPKGPAVFRLPEHLRRLQDSCKIYRFDLPWSAEQLTAAIVDLIQRNELAACYVRPMVLRGYGSAGLNPIGVGVETWLACWPWGAYLGDEALQNGVDVCVASWQRGAPNTFPALAKSAGHYNNSQLIKAEATVNGFAEGIALGTDGLVSEGSGQNLFLVRDGKLVTTPVSGTILSGITRDSIMVIAQELGIPCQEQPIPRETLYTADELFFTGTAAEVTPIRSVDRIPVGTGKAGKLTLALQKRFMDIVEGRTEDRYGWLTPVGSA